MRVDSDSRKESGWERKADGLARALQECTRQHISSVLPVRAQSTNSESHKSGGTSPSSSRGVKCPDKTVFSIGTLVHSAAGIMIEGWHDLFVKGLTPHPDLISIANH